MILAVDKQAIFKNAVLKEFQNWGDVFKVEFSIKLTKWPTPGWTNVFHFTPNSNHHRIPAIWIHSNGYFYIYSAVNGHAHHYINFKYVIGKQYHMTIQQLKYFGKYWYEIILNDVTILRVENRKPKRFPKVKLYASDPWHNPFSSDLGWISHIKTEQGEG